MQENSVEEAHQQGGEQPEYLWGVAANKNLWESQPGSTTVFFYSSLGVYKAGVRPEDLGKARMEVQVDKHAWHVGL